MKLIIGWIHVCDFKVKVDNSCNRTDLHYILVMVLGLKKGAVNIFCSGGLILGECIYAALFTLVSAMTPTLSFD